MLSEKITDYPYICGVFFSFEEQISHVVGATLQQNFFDALPPASFEKVYVTKSKTGFQESFQNNASGGVYTQQVTISMPRSSYDRSEKIKKIIAARFIMLKLSNGRILVIGQNDYKQNTKIKASYIANEHLAQFQFTNRSIFPIGYTELEGIGFPYHIPAG